MHKGDVVPDFTLPDQTGTPRSLSGFLANGPVVLFFYPAAMTYGCTKESCHFRDMAGEFAAVGAQPVGISADAVEKQKQFDEKETLGFPLLSDSDRTVASQLGAKRGVSFLPNKRVTFVIDTDRTLLDVIHTEVSMGAHADKALALLKRRAPLPDRTVVITGAASGIGAATAARLGAAGWTVVGVDKDETDIVADLATPAGRREAVEKATERCGGLLAGIVTCAGLAGTPDRAGSLVASVNYFGTVDVLEGLRPLLSQGGAAVVISSNSTTVQPAIPADLVAACLDHDEKLSAQIADTHTSLEAYPAAKLALAHWVRQNATGSDWAGSGLRLNAIAPGMIDTPMVAGMRADPKSGPLLDMLPIPVGRPGRPEEIAALVELLLGPDGAFFCGSVIFCDGGSDALLRTKDWPAAWDISVRGLGRQLS